MPTQSDNTPLPITVCMLTLNEADRLPRTLVPVKHFAEFIVLDTGSTDDSIQLAKDAGATTRQTTWQGFSKTRVEHFNLATQPWILWIDADEVITPELITELKNLFNTHPQHAAYLINRMIHFKGKWIKHGDWFPDYNIRLFRADAWTMQNRDVHESLEINGTVGKLKNHLEHYSYRTWQDRYDRGEKYAKLWAEMQRKKGKQVSSAGAHFRTIWRFIRGYFFKLGFLDGIMGIRVAYSNAWVTHRKYKHLRQPQP